MFVVLFNQHRCNVSIDRGQGGRVCIIGLFEAFFLYLAQGPIEILSFVTQHKEVYMLLSRLHSY